MDINEVISPPFDVVSPKQAQSLKSRKYNITHLTLPDTTNLDRVRDMFALWKSNGILERSGKDIVIVVDQTYMKDGWKKRLTGLIALVNIIPDDGTVRPHELTFKGPVEERVRIMGALDAQLEPIYLAVDSDNIETMLRRVIFSKRPDINFTDLAGTENSIYFIQENENINAIKGALEHSNAIVADGHHRLAATRRLAEATSGYSHSFWSKIMAYIVPLSSDGLMVGGIHRCIMSGTKFSNAIPELSRHMIVSGAEGPDPESPLNVYDGQWYSIRLRDGYCAKYPDNCLSSIHMLNEILLRDAMHFNPSDYSNKVHYTHDLREAVNYVNDGNADFCVIMPEWDRNNLLELIERYGVLPQKSTYFYPKISSGIALNCLVPSDH
ncbi:MAG: DUF1015 family protein [Thermoplasmataceae archaeon]